MKLDKTNRCDNCGSRIRMIRSPVTIKGLSILSSRIPSYCPHCGKEISIDRQNEMMTRNWMFFSIFFCPFCLITMVVIIINIFT